MIPTPEGPAGMPERLENDIRELSGANPAELAQRLIERGWTLAADEPETLLEIDVERLREALEVAADALNAQTLRTLDLLGLVKEGLEPAGPGGSLNIDHQSWRDKARARLSQPTPTTKDAT